MIFSVGITFSDFLRTTHNTIFFSCIFPALLYNVANIFLLTPMQTTLVLLKPDTVQRSLIGKIVSRFEEKGIKII